MLKVAILSAVLSLIGYLVARRLNAPPTLAEVRRWALAHGCRIVYTPKSEQWEHRESFVMLAPRPVGPCVSIAVGLVCRVAKWTGVRPGQVLRAIQWRRLVSRRPENIR